MGKILLEPPTYLQESAGLLKVFDRIGDISCGKTTLPFSQELLGSPPYSVWYGRTDTYYVRG